MKAIVSSVSLLLTDSNRLLGPGAGMNHFRRDTFVDQNGGSIFWLLLER